MEKNPHSFCETPEENCTMNYCYNYGCQNRKRELVNPELTQLRAENERLKEMIQLKDLYIGILSHDLEDSSSIAFIHGYESRWVKQGFDVRKKIDALEITNP